MAVEKLPDEYFYLFHHSEMVQVSFKAAPMPLFYQGAPSDDLN